MIETDKNSNTTTEKASDLTTLGYPYFGQSTRM